MDVDKIIGSKLDEKLEKSAAAIPVVHDSVTKVVETKEDIIRELTPDQEYHRLFSGTDKYNRPIQQIKDAIHSGSNIINIVSPGYAGSPAKEITDLIVSSALQEGSTLPDDASFEEKEEDYKKRSESRSRSIIAERRFNTNSNEAEAASENLSVVDSLVLGQGKFNPNSNKNLFYDYLKDPENPILQDAIARHMQGDAGGRGEAPQLTQKDFMNLMFSNRQNDIIYDPDNPKSYFYTCHSFGEHGEHDMNAIESMAHRARQMLKTSGVSSSDTEKIKTFYGQLNAAQDVPYGQVFVPYGIELTEEEYSEIVSAFSSSFSAPWKHLEEIESAEDFPRWLTENIDDLDLEDFPIDNLRTLFPGGQPNAQGVESLILTTAEWLRNNIPSQLSNLIKRKRSAPKRSLFAELYGQLVSYLVDDKSLSDLLMQRDVGKAVIDAVEDSVDNPRQARRDGMIVTAAVSGVSKFDDVEDLIVMNSNLSKEDRALARAYAKEFVSGKIRKDLVRSMHSSPESAGDIPFQVPAAGNSQPSINILSQNNNSFQSSIKFGDLIDAIDIDEANLQGTTVGALTNSLNYSMLQLVSGVFVYINGEKKKVNTHNFRIGVEPNKTLNEIDRDTAVQVTIEGFDFDSNDDNDRIVPATNISLGIETMGPLESIKNLDYQSLDIDIDEIHDEYGIKINRGPLPNWMPDPYDFRETLSFTLGHSNNVYQIKNALDKRFALLQKFRSEVEFDAKRRDMYECPISILKKELSEMTEYLKWIEKKRGGELAHSGERDVTGELGSKSRDTGRSLSRYFNSDSDYFYEDIKNRAHRAGLSLPIFNRFVNKAVVEETLGKNDLEIFRKVYADAARDWGVQSREVAPSYVVFKGIDQVSSSPRAFNGLIDVKSAEGGPVAEHPEGGGGGGEILSISARFAETISKFASEAKNSSRSNSALILVTSNKIPDKELKGVEVSYVYVDAHVVSPEEIEQYIALYTDEAKRDATEEADSEEMISLIKNFFFPSTFIDILAAGLSNLEMSTVKVYLRGLVDRLIDQYLKTGGDLYSLIENNELAIEKDIYDKQSENEASRKLNFKNKIPTYKPTGYKTQEGSEWNNYIVSKFGPIIDNIQNAKRKMSLVLRMKDLGISIAHQATDPESGKARWAFGPKSGRPHFWINTNGQIAPINIDSITEKETSSIFGKAKTSLYEVLTQKAEKDNVPVEEYTSRGLPEDQVSNILRAMDLVVDHCKAAMQKEKTKFPNTIFLYGCSGSGKTIFGDVLAKAFGAQLEVGKLEEIFNAGRSSMFVGQRENNLIDLFNLLRNSKNKVFILDEFHKFFQAPEGQSHSGISEVTSMFQTGLENDRGIYSANNVYIIGTSNQPPSFFTGNQTSALMRRFQLKARVEVPTNVNTLREIFTSDVLINNIINNRYDNPLVIDRVTKLIDAYQKNDETKKAILIKDLLETDQFFFENGILYPEEAKSLYRQRCGLEDESYDVSNADADKVISRRIDDFVEGWIQLRNSFSDMDKPNSIKYLDEKGNEVEAEVSPLEIICAELERKMLWLDEGESPRDVPSGNRPIFFTKANMSTVNDIVVDMFQSQADFMSGEPDALPINAQNLYFAVALANWADVGDEAKTNQKIQELERRTAGECSGSTWGKLKALVRRAVSDSSINITYDVFQQAEDVLYKRDVIRDSLYGNDDVVSEIDSGQIVGMTSLIKKLVNNLGLKDDYFESQVMELISLLDGQGGDVQSPSGSVATFFRSFMTIRNMAKEAVSLARSKPENYEDRIEEVALRASALAIRAEGHKIENTLFSISRTILGRADTAMGGDNAFSRRIYKNLVEFKNAYTAYSSFGDMVGEEEEYESINDKIVSDLETIKDQTLYGVSSEFREFTAIRDGVSEATLHWVMDRNKSIPTYGMDVANEDIESLRAQLNGQSIMTATPVVQEPEAGEVDEDIPLDLGEFENGDDQQAPVREKAPAPGQQSPTEEVPPPPPTSGGVIEDVDEEDEDEENLERNKKSSSSISGAIFSSQISLIGDGNYEVIDAENSSDYLCKFISNTKKAQAVEQPPEIVPDDTEQINEQPIDNSPVEQDPAENPVQVNVEEEQAQQAQAPQPGVNVKRVPPQLNLSGNSVALQRIRNYYAVSDMLNGSLESNFDSSVLILGYNGSEKEGNEPTS